MYVGIILMTNDYGDCDDDGVINNTADQTDLQEGNFPGTNK